jgi:hypothetical protein
VTQFDPLDSIDPVEQSWQRFRTRLAAALLLDWLLRDVDASIPDYFADLWNRLQSGFDYEEIFKREGQPSDEVPVHSIDDRQTTWLGVDDLRDLFEVLFPHGREEAPSLDSGRQLVVVMLYSAVEALVDDLGLRRRGMSALSCLEERLNLPAADEGLHRLLLDLKETRNLIAHNGGAVDRRYAQRFPDHPWAEGETRMITAQDIQRFSAATRSAGKQLIANLRGSPGAGA